LSQIKKLRVMSRTTVMQYKHAKKPLQEIAQELRVDAIVEGLGGPGWQPWRISAKLVQTNIEGSRWADSFERQYSDVLALQSDVATAIARNPGGIEQRGTNRTRAQSQGGSRSLRILSAR
jgi:TolB-like protein